LNSTKLSIFIAGIHQETPLNIDFGIKMKDSTVNKIGTVGRVLVGRG
jgi:hypothetical protein